MQISPFLLERHFAEYEFEVPFQLSCSDCEPLSLSELLAMASPDSVRLWENLKLSYTESAGNPLLRREVAHLYENVKPDEILICVPEEGIFLVMNSMLTAGDHMVVISPAYQSLHAIGASMGCEVSHWEPDDRGLYRVDRLKSLITPITRMVVINFPHNPTGAHISRSDLVEIARFCDKNGILLFSDEMYRGLEQDPSDRLPCAPDLSCSSIALSGTSKSLALPGLRIGWLVCRDRQVMERLIQLKDYTTICSSAPSEILAVIALQNNDRIVARNLAIISRNIRLVGAFVERNSQAVSWIPPKAGSVAFLSFRHNRPVEMICRELIEKKGVLAIGSHLFNSGKPAIRLGLGRIAFGEALDRSEGIIGEY
jgi:aspartate/methionine/tyrosine aminotransferase